MSLHVLSQAASERSNRERNPVGALIVGGAHGSLGLARSLGQRGIPVWFVIDDHPIAKYSRYVKRSFAWAGPAHDGAVNFLLGLAGRHGLEGWVLMASGDAEARLMSQHYAELSSVFCVTVPPWDIVRWAHDKRLTYQRAAMLGINIPLTYHAHDLMHVARLNCRFPVVLKPNVHEQKNAFTQAKAWRCDDRTSLLSRYEQAVALVGEQGVVLQELIPGGGPAQFSYAAVWDRGSPVASLVARRTRQYPVDFGYTSTFVETVERPEVEDAACRFLRSLDYSGLVEVEFKYDARDRRYKILDVNARAWTWNALGSLAGVDFAHVLWQVAMGEAIEPVRRPPAEVAWMHGSRDIVAACQEMLAGRLSLRTYISGWRKPLVFAAFAKDDPLPGIVDLPLAVSRVLLRRMPGLAKGSPRSRADNGALAQHAIEAPRFRPAVRPGHSTRGSH